MFGDMPDPGPEITSNVLSGLHRLQQEFEFILYGPKLGHRFPERYDKERPSVACLLCRTEFELETDSRIPVPRGPLPCPNHRTHEGEKGQRATDEAYRIYKDATELAVDAMFVFRASLKLRELRKRLGEGSRQVDDGSGERPTVLELGGMRDDPRE